MSVPANLNENAPINGELVERSATDLVDSTRKYKHHFVKESGTHYRISNNVISNLLQMSNDAWRVFESITKELDIYPDELVNDGAFLEMFYRGEAHIPLKYRTVKLFAKDYIKAYSLTETNGYRDFTLNSLALFEEPIKHFSFSKSNTLDITITHPVSKITFHTQVRNDEGERVTRVVSSESIRRNGDTTSVGKIWSAHSITFVLDEELILHMLLLRNFFTRIERKSAERLSKACVKLYTLLLMHKGSSKPVDGAWMIQLDLNQCNALTSTNYQSIVAYANNFRLADELNRKTELEVHIDKDNRTKEGKKFTHLNIFFSEKSAKVMAEIGIEKKITRKLKMRPRCLVGSDAEGRWARENIKILLDYKAKLQEVGRVLPKADRDRLDTYYSIIGQK
ncbi:hypothetical protein [Vibrio sp. Hal054]|uniref:hypothetical protein n=1 Tax=Vibrio sp. Hal054 TaxID=3035158 RepID=UPI00301D8FAE